MMGEGGEVKFETNINFFLEEYGIMVNNGESVVMRPCQLFRIFLSQCC
jgi:hypothetical protein